MAAARLARWFLPALALGVAACGSSGEDDRFKLTTPKAPPATTATAAPSGVAEPVTRAEAAAIRGWADTLRRGHPLRAARFFAVPAYVSNNSPLYRLRSRAQVAYFNRTLPCGAKVVELERAPNHLVLATFRLTERPGQGSCGTGTGALARTAFRVRRGHIVQWLRAPDPPQEDA